MASSPYRVLKVEEKAHDDGVWCVSWRGQRIVTGAACATGRVKTWNVSAGAAFALTAGTPVAGADFPLAVVAVTQQPDGAAFAAGSLDGTLLVFDPAAGPDAAPRALPADPGCAWGAAFSPAGGPLLAATGQGGTVCVYNTAEGRRTQTLRSAAKCCTSLAWSATGRLLAAGGTDGTATVFDAVGGRRLLSIPAHAKPVRAVRFSGDGTMLVTAGDDGCINVRDVEKGALVASITGHESWVCALDTCARAPRTLVSGGADGTVRLWDLSVNAHVHTFSEHHGQCWGVALNDDATMVASVADDKSLVVSSLV